MPTPELTYAARPGPKRRKRSALSGTLGPVYRALMHSIPENRLGDRLFSYIRFAVHHGSPPSGANTYNDVFYRIKTSDDSLDPLRVFVSDKEFVNLYVKATVGDESNVPTFEVIRSKGGVDTYEFPPDCCIKPTHASGRVVSRRRGEQVGQPDLQTDYIQGNI